MPFPDQEDCPLSAKLVIISAKLVIKNNMSIVGLRSLGITHVTGNVIDSIITAAVNAWRDFGAFQRLEPCSINIFAQAVTSVRPPRGTVRKIMNNAGIAVLRPLPIFLSLGGQDAVPRILP
jgi:hypothetical protein